MSVVELLSTMSVFINGIPINVWPYPRAINLCDIADVEDVDYVELETIKSDERVKKDN